MPNPSAATPAGPFTRNTSARPSLRPRPARRGRPRPHRRASGHHHAPSSAPRRPTPGCRAGTARSGSWPCRWAEQPRRRDRRDLLPDRADPGSLSKRPVAAAGQRARSLKRRMWSTMSAIAARSSGATCRRAASSSSRRRAAHRARRSTPSKRASARHTASSPCSRTSSMSSPICPRSAGEMERSRVRGRTARTIGRSHLAPAHHPQHIVPCFPLSAARAIRSLIACRSRPLGPFARSSIPALGRSGHSLAFIVQRP